MAKIKYKRLVTFGCSNTYGHGLPDCVDNALNFGPKPSKFAWPNHLARSLGIETIENCAVPGSSNKQIARLILAYPFEKTDLVVVGWSFIERDCIFKFTTDDSILHKQNVINLGVSGRDKANKLWQKNYFDYYDRCIETGMFSTLGSKHIRSCGARYVGFFCCLHDVKQYDQNSKDFDPVTNINFAHILQKYGRTQDKFHPSLESHYEIAKKVEELI